MMTATYSPEDNKLRLYSTGRLGAETFQRVKAAGFRWAPKQELFVAPMWTPEREDLLIDLCGEVGDEDTSLVDRQAERAERFEEYSDRRESDAERAKAAVDAIADQIPLGQPILVGHHSEKMARKNAEKIERGMRQAVNLWRTSQYWSHRAAGAIRHAKYKELPGVRARRIKGLEADKRKQERARDEAARWLKEWARDDVPLTLERAKGIANYCHVSRCFTLAEFPRELPASQYEGVMSLWSALDDGICTPEQARDIATAAHRRVIVRADRWAEHYGNRLGYERAMLADAGGIAADKTGPEKGGAVRCWCSPGHGRGWSYIKKVNKVSVTVEDNWGNGGQNFTRVIPFDNLKAVMTVAEVEAARAAGRLVESSVKDGFFLADDAPEPTRPAPEPDAQAEAFDQLADALKAGVQVVTAPQLFPTPPEIAAQVAALACIGPDDDVLEPSAGTGSLIRAVIECQPFAAVYAVEINAKLCEALADITIDRRCADFLSLNGELGQFDRVVMNPPFSMGDDIRHVLHALDKLKPGGRLVSVVANGPRQREKLQPLASQWIDLPAGSFADQGTNVNAAIVVIDR